MTTVSMPRSRSALPRVLARQAIDVGHNLARRRNLAHRTLGAEHVLHVDHDQRSLMWLDRLEAVQAAAAKDDAIDHMGGQLGRVHTSLLRYRAL